MRRKRVSQGLSASTWLVGASREAKTTGFFVSDPVSSPAYNHQLTNFYTSMPQRRNIIPSGCAECAAPWFSAHPLARLAHLEMRKLLAFLCLTPWVPPPTITSSRTSIPRCPSVASLYRVDAPKAPVLRIKRIHLACQRISKCKHYSLFYV
jgi:hypothetical protein